MKNPYTIDRLLQKADFLGMYTIRPGVAEDIKDLQRMGMLK